MQTLIVKDKSGQVIMRIQAMSKYQIDTPYQLVETLLDEANSIDKPLDQDTTTD